MNTTVRLPRKISSALAIAAISMGGIGVTTVATAGTAHAADCQDI